GGGGARGGCRGSVRGHRGAGRPRGSGANRFAGGVACQRARRLTRTVTAVIAEDEPLLRDELEEHLRKLWPELEIIGKAGDGIDALRLLVAHNPAVLFLDIQMPGMTGLEVAKQAAGRCHVVFVTAFDQYAVAAF